MWIEGATQGNGRMREVTADAVAPFDDLGRGQISATGQIAVFNVVVDPIADRLYARATVGDLAKLTPRKIHQFVRIAIAAGQCVAQHLGRELAHGHDLVGHVRVIRLGRNRDERVVPDFIATGHERRAASGVAVAVLKFIRRHTDAERRFFLHHQHPTFEAWFEYE